MSVRLKSMFSSLFDVDPQERLKLLFLSVTFFFVIGAYTIIRDLKNSIFMSIVGKEYINYASLVALLGLVPAILFYSKLVDKVRRYYLLVVYAVFYSLLLLVCAYFLGHPTIGLSNTDQGKWRLFGWLFYFLVEGYSPFMVSVFWAFANSITTPGAAKNYGLMVTGSKLGGMCSAGFAWYFFTNQISMFGGVLTDTVKHQVVLLIAACMVAMVPVIVSLLMRAVPGRYLHGYEAVYQVEKDKGKKPKKGRSGVFEGLRLMLKTPYVLGIFGVVFFYEILAKALGYLRLIVAESTSHSVSGMSSFLFKQIFFMHTVGFFISLIGTSYLLKRFGTRLCLLLIPVSMGAVLLLFIFNRNPLMIIAALTGLKAINYAFSWPVRESLYIPTVKEVKFKSKSWIDAFGSKFAKASGSTFNVFAEGLGAGFFLPVYSFFFAITIGLWFAVAFFLGKRYDKAIDNNEVIGLAQSGDDA